MAAQKRVFEAVEDYLAYRRARVSLSTWANDTFILRRFGAYLGDIQLRHVTADRMSDWFYGQGGVMSEHRTRDGQHRAPISATSHNYYRTRIGGFCRYLSLRGLVKVVLMADIAPKPVHQRRRQQPAPHILLSLLDQAESSRDRAYLALAINTGCRASEIARLRVGDVDLDTGYLALTIQKTREDDLAPITSDLDQELRRWLTTYGSDLGRPLRGDDYLVPAYGGSRYVWSLNDEGVRERGRVSGVWRPDRPVTHTERIVQNALRAVGLPTLHEGTHTIRRAVARAFFDSMAADVGYDNALRTVSALLHHRSSATTEKYLQLTSERKRRDALLRGQPFMTALVTSENVVPLRKNQS